MNSIRLEIKGLGAVPSFKNSKLLISRDRNGKPLPSPRLITKPEYQQWMDKAEESIVLRLLFTFPTEGGETRQECWKRLRTFLCGLRDDSVNDLPEGSWRVKRVPKGEEGAEIILEKL